MSGDGMHYVTSWWRMNGTKTAMQDRVVFLHGTARILKDQQRLARWHAMCDRIRAQHPRRP